VLLTVCRQVAALPVDIGRLLLLLPAGPTQERQTDQLAQVTLAHRRGVAFLATRTRWQLTVPHQDGGGRVDLGVDCIDGVGRHVWVVSPIVGRLLADQL